jgi:hypothetical protein
MYHRLFTACRVLKLFMEKSSSISRRTASTYNKNSEQSPRGGPPTCVFVRELIFLRCKKTNQGGWHRSVCNMHVGDHVNTTLLYEHFQLKTPVGGPRRRWTSDYILFNNTVHWLEKIRLRTRSSGGSYTINGNLIRGISLRVERLSGSQEGLRSMRVGK